MYCNHCKAEVRSVSFVVFNDLPTVRKNVIHGELEIHARCYYCSRPFDVIKVQLKHSVIMKHHVCEALGLEDDFKCIAAFTSIKSRTRAEIDAGKAAFVIASTVGIKCDICKQPFIFDIDTTVPEYVQLWRK